MASIRKRGKNYQITVSNGRDIHDKQILETITWTPDPEKTDKQNEKDLQKFALDFEERVKNGRCLKGRKMTYLEYSKLWMEQYSTSQMEDTSYETTESYLRLHILPAIGHIRLSELQPLHITRLYNKMAETGYTRNGKHMDYSPSTIKRVHQIINSSLNTAVQWQLIESNPCERAKPPKSAKIQKDNYLTLEQTKAFFAQLDEPYRVPHGGRLPKNGVRRYDTKKFELKYKVLLYVAVFGGFRRGELVSLTWDDVDLDANTINITKSTARTKRYGNITKAPKNGHSVRKIVLPDFVIDMLREYKAEQDRYKTSLGDYWDGDNYIFIQNGGQRIDLSTPNKIVKKVIRIYNAEHEDKLPDITLHGLRHTSATLLISQNVDVKTVSRRLGHAETSTTMNIYAHALEKRDTVASDSLGALFDEK